MKASHHLVEELQVEQDWKATLKGIAGRRADRVLLAGLALVVALASSVAWTRRAPAQIAPPAGEGVVPEMSPGVAPVGAEVFVHVAGAVRSPGLYGLPEGSRVADALSAAGGPKGRADLDALNLAQLLSDGLKIEVPRKGEAATGSTPATASGTDAAATGTPATVSLNGSDQAALETVPGLGPVKAGAIVRFREESGPFTALEQVMEVSGIGPATFEQIRPFITL